MSATTWTCRRSLDYPFAALGRDGSAPTSTQRTAVDTAGIRWCSPARRFHLGPHRGIPGERLKPRLFVLAAPSPSSRWAEERCRHQHCALRHPFRPVELQQLTVARAAAVRATILASTSWNASLQRSRRGWNRGTSSPVSGSMDPMSLPLCRLHAAHANARLSSVVVPPCFSATTWSTSCAKSAVASGARQYSQRTAGPLVHQPSQSRGDVRHGALSFARALPLAMRTRCSAYS